MEKNKKKRLIFPFIYLLLSPILFVLFDLIFAKTVNFDYNKTLVTNIAENIDGTNKRFTLSFEDKKNDYIEGWDNYSTIFNRDFYGSCTVFRTSKESFSLSSQNGNSDIIFSDIQQCDVKNNQRWNYSALNISTSMEDFKEDSIFIDDTLAENLSLKIGDRVSINHLEETINFTVSGIYSHDSNNTRYLNNTYYEFDYPVCFISRAYFNQISKKSFNSYVNFCSDESLVKAGYVELSPLLNSSSIHLIVDNRFATNDFSINNQKLQDLQKTLYASKQEKKTFVYYLLIAIIVLILLEDIYLLYSAVKPLIQEDESIYRFNVLFGFLYSVYVICVALLGAVILKNFYSTTIINQYVLYNSLKEPLVTLAIFTLYHILVASICIFVASRGFKNKANENRLLETKQMQKKNDKVVFVTGSLSRGGAEKVIVELANYYASLGREVDIVILLNNVVDWELNKNIKVINFTGDTKSRIKRIGYWLKSLKKYFSENINATIVSFLVRVNILVLLTAKRKNHKIIISERNDPRYDGRGIIVSVLVSFLYPKADRIVFQTDDCKKLFPKETQEIGVVISNPIRIEKYASINYFDRNLFISAGRITEQKNQILMIKAMKEVVKVNKNARLEIYGDGKLSKKLKKKIIDLDLDNNVFIHPNTRQINEKILNSAAYICSSFYEGMSNSLMEATFAGIPCITTRCLGTDMIKESRNGFFIDYDSPKVLSEVMIKILNDNQFYNSLRKESIIMAKSTKHEDVYLKWKDCIDNE